MARPTKAESDKKQLESFDDSVLDELAKFLGTKLEDGLDREGKIAALVKAKNTSNVSIAREVVVDGETVECPLGYAIIKVHTKTGQEFGEISRQTLFMNCHGDICVVRRGVAVKVKEKFLHLLKAASWEEITQIDDGDPSRNVAPKREYRRIPTELFEILAHNPDLEAAEKAERDLIKNAAEADQARKQQKLMAQAVLNQFAPLNR